MFRIIVRYYCVRPPRYCLECLNVDLIKIISNYCRGRFCENWRFYPTYCNCYLLILIIIIMIVINAVIIPTLRERKPQWFWRANILRPGCRAHVSMLSWVQVDKIKCNFNFNLQPFLREANSNYIFRRERGKGFDNAKCFFMNGTASWYHSPDL